MVSRKISLFGKMQRGRSPSFELFHFTCMVCCAFGSEEPKKMNVLFILSIQVCILFLVFLLWYIYSHFLNFIFTRTIPRFELRRDRKRYRWHVARHVQADQTVQWPGRPEASGRHRQKQSGQVQTASAHPDHHLQSWYQRQTLGAGIYTL